MGKTIAIYCHKGGTGKTTTIANLAATMLLDKKRVLLVDLDEQCSLTSMFLEGEAVAEAEGRTVFDALRPGGTGARPVHVKYGLDILVGSEKMSCWPDLVINEMRREYLLKSLLAPFKKVYDYILIDCPCHFGTIVINTLTAANSVLVPMRCDVFTIGGLKQTLEHVDMVKDNTNSSLRILGILPTFYSESRTLPSGADEVVRKKYGGRVLSTRIRNCQAVADAPAYKKDIISYRPKSAGAEDYIALYDELKPELEK